MITFVFISAANCGACKQFKQRYWETTLKGLKAIKGLNIRTIELTSTSSDLPADSPKDLRRFVSWYPTFILLAPGSWNSEVVSGVVYNGVETASGNFALRPVGERKPNDATAIISWVMNEMNTNPILKNSNQLEPLHNKRVFRHTTTEKNETTDTEVCGLGFLPLY